MMKDLYISRDISQLALFEEWRQVRDYNLEISNTGKFRNTKTGKVLKQQTNWNGRKYIRFTTHTGYKVKLYTHKEVATAFIPQVLPERTEIDHIHSFEENSILSLQWVTSTENKELSYRRGTHKSKLTFEQAQMIRTEAMYCTHVSLANKYGVSPQTIGRIVRNEVHIAY